MPETEVVDSPEATESISTLPDASIETPESAASETAKEPPAESKNWSLDEWKEHPEFSEWYEEERRESHMSGQEREYGRTQELLKSVRTELLDKATNLESNISRLNQVLARAIEEDPSGVARELSKDPQVWREYKEALQLSQELKGRDSKFQQDASYDDVIMFNIANAMYLAAETAGDKSIAEPFIKSFAREYRFDEGKGSRAFTRLIKQIEKSAEEKGYKRGLNAGKDVASEVQKGAERSGKAPPAAIGSAGSGRPTAQQYAAATPEQRAAWAEKGIEPLV